MNNTGIIICLAYPDTVVRTAEEWYSPFLRFIGVGKKHYIRAGHAALVLISKSEETIAYHDYGRYVTALSFGRVRCAAHDRELEFPLKAVVENGVLINLEEILIFLGNHPELTHGEGKLIASVCSAVNYEAAKKYIDASIRKGATPYAAFLKNATNCARFVTDTLINSVTDNAIKRRLQRSQWFTPSTVGNVILANTEANAYLVENGSVEKFTKSSRSETLRCFLDPLRKHTANIKGTLEAPENAKVPRQSQWLPGIGAGAWFVMVSKLDEFAAYRIQRISPKQNIDVDGIFKVNDTSFDINQSYTFTYTSHCAYCVVIQNEKYYFFKFIRDFENV